MTTVLTPPQEIALRPVKTYAELQREVEYWKQLFLNLKTKYEPDMKAETPVSLRDVLGRPVMSQADAARRLHVTRGTVCKRVKAGKLTGVAIKGKKALYVLQSSVDALMEGTPAQ